MKIGDLVKSTNLWKKYNPWMDFPDENSIGVLVYVGDNVLIVQWADKPKAEATEPDSVELYNESR